MHRDFLLPAYETLTPKVRQRTLGGGVLGVVAPSIAILVSLDLIDFTGDGEGRRPFAGSLIAFNDAQTFALYPTKTSRHLMLPP